MSKRLNPAATATLMGLLALAPAAKVGAPAGDHGMHGKKGGS